MDIFFNSVSKRGDVDGKKNVAFMKKNQQKEPNESKLTPWPILFLSG